MGERPTTRIGTIIDAPRKTPHQQRSRRTVDTLLEAAAQVFEREGLAATTNRIAERSGFSIGTLYQYFPNKHALLAALAQRHVDHVAECLCAVFADLDRRDPSWIESVRTLAAELTALHSDRPRLHALLYDHAPRIPEGVHRLQELHNELTTALAAQLRRCGLARGDAETRRTAALLVHTAEATLHRVLLHDGPAPHGSSGDISPATPLASATTRAEPAHTDLTGGPAPSTPDASPDAAPTGPEDDERIADRAETLARTLLALSLP